MLQKVKKLILLAKKCFKCFNHTSFLESFYSYQVVPVGLRIKKSPGLPIISEDFDKSWRNTLRESELINECTMRSMQFHIWIQPEFFTKKWIPDKMSMKKMILIIGSVN